MKSKFIRIVSSVLTLCMILSLFTVFAGAESNKSEEVDTKDLEVLYNRNFEEGWDWKNGFDGNQGTIARVEKKLGYDFKYNYFLCFEDSGENKNEFIYKNAKIEGKGKTFIEFDISANENSKFGNSLMFVTPGAGSARAFEYFCGVNDGQLCLVDVPVCTVGEEWVHVGFEINWDYSEEDPLQYLITACYETKDGKTGSINKIMTAGSGGKGIYTFRFGAELTSNIGEWVGYDNFKVYTGVDTFCELPEDNHGKWVNENAKKDFPILNGEDDGSWDLESVLNDSIVMKKNVENCLFKNKKTPILEKDGVIYGAPVEIDGEIMVSLELLLKYIDYPYYIHPDGQSFDIPTGTSATYLTVGRDSAVVAGERVKLNKAPGYVDNNGNKYLAVAMSDIENLFPGFYVSYDTMGLIVVAKVDNVIDRQNTSLDTFMDIMKKFIFDDVTADGIYDRVKTHTNNFDHPYIYANQDRFDYLKSVYEAKVGDENYNEELLRYIKRIIGMADSQIRQRVIFDENENYVKIDEEKLPVNRNYEKFSDGYDVGGRLSVPSGLLTPFAFAYQITKDPVYLKFAYEWIVALGNWPHWGAGHFLNCAGASEPIAICIDWMYDGFAKEGMNISKLVNILYTHGVHQGYLASTGQAIDYPRTRQGDGSRYTRMTNNWNAVCCAGMTISSLAIMGETNNPLYKKESTELMEDNILKLMDHGLGQYAPDGSYVESAGYWAYGTNHLFKLIMALDSATGGDLGLMDTWGLDKTCYFATHAEDSDFHAFSYHDGSINGMETECFSFVGQYIGDLGLVAIRKGQVNAGKAITLFDVLFYMDDKDLKNSELPLQYKMEGIDGFTMRSSWEKGSMFAGIMGGDNHASHGQVDTGAFVYHNKGVVWIYDLGGDDYNVKNYFGTYNYYRRNAEGNNTLCLTSVGKLPFGQELDSVTHITETYENEHGTYVIMDNTDAFAGIATYWRRGMMATEDRNTVVVQDEVSLKGIQSICWSAHINIKDMVREYKLSADGRTAYLTSYKNPVTGKEYTLRASIVSENTSFKFEILDCYTFMLQETYRPGKSESLGGQPEKSRDDFRKLVIKGESVLSFNVAVVFEIMESKDEKEVGYKWCPMQNWEPVELKENVEENVAKRDVAKRTDIKLNITKANRLLEKGKAYGESMSEYYRTLCDLEYACIAFANEDLTPDIVELYRQKKTLLKDYDAFVTEINKNISTQRNFINSVLG